MFPVQVSFQDTPTSDAVEAACLREAEKLLRYFDRIVGCNVTIARPHKRHGKGSHYVVRIVLDVPQGTVVVNRDPLRHVAHEKVELAVREAFDHARRRLQDHARRMRGDTKRHATPLHGRVVELFPEDGYGFVETLEGERLYLHENALVSGAFGDLGIGSEVTFAAEQGEEGLRAKTVRVARRHQGTAI